MGAMPNTSPAKAWKALKEGNERFVSGHPEHPSQSIEHRASLAVAQRPTAVVFGCADSRVAAEIIFDQGLGDMFVVRTAGHVIETGAQLLSRSTAIGEGVEAGEVAIVGVTYHLADGRIVLREHLGDIGEPGDGTTGE